MHTANLTLLKEIRLPALGLCPVELLGYALYRDPEVMRLFLTLNLRNDSGKTVSEIYVDLCGFDRDFRLIWTKREQPMTPLAVPAGQEFGSEFPFSLPSLQTADVTITVSKVCYEDGKTWSLRAQNAPAPAPGSVSKVRGFLARRKAEKLLWQDKTPPTPEAIQKLRKTRLLRLAAAGTAAVLAAAAATGTYRYFQKRDQALDVACAFYEAGDYPRAEAAFAALKRYRFPREQADSNQLHYALACVRNENYAGALRELAGLHGRMNSGLYLRQLNAVLAGTVSAGERHTVALRRDGTAVAAGDSAASQCYVSPWTDLVAVACGLNHTLGLKADGTVEAVGPDEYSQCAVGSWQDIVGIAAGERHSVGVTAGGRVVAAGDNSFGQCETQAWSGVVAVAAGRLHTVALRQDGTVAAAGDNSMGACNVDSWENIVAIAAGNGFTVGVKEDGTLVAAGDNTYEECMVGHITDAAAAAAGDFHILALQAGGRLAGAGDNIWRQRETSLWKNLVAVAGGVHHSVGITQEGTAWAAGDNKSGQCAVENWDNLGLPLSALRATGFEIQQED